MYKQLSMKILIIFILQTQRFETGSYSLEISIDLKLVKLKE